MDAQATTGQGNKFQQLIAESTYALVILANEDTGEWRLIEPQEVAEVEARTYAEHGLTFAGVLGIVGLKPRTELLMPLADETVAVISLEFVRRWARSITHPRWYCIPAPGVN
jgi:hypothetical protein